MPAAESAKLFAACTAHGGRFLLCELQWQVGPGCAGDWHVRKLRPPTFFRDTGFHNLDLSIAKNWKFYEETHGAVPRREFNVTNHPNFANPWGGTSGFGAGHYGRPCPSAHSVAVAQLLMWRRSIRCSVQAPHALFSSD